MLSIFKWCQRNATYYFRQSVFLPASSAPPLLLLLLVLFMCCSSGVFAVARSEHFSPFALPKNFSSKNTPSFLHLRLHVILVLFFFILFSSLRFGVRYAFRHSADVVLFLNLMTQLIDCYLEENNTRHSLSPSSSTTSTNKTFDDDDDNDELSNVSQRWRGVGETNKKEKKKKTFPGKTCAVAFLGERPIALIHSLLISTHNLNT